jgi:hypothetical protein
MNAGQEQAAAGRPPNGQRGSYIPSFLFISFALFMLTNHNGDEYLARHKYRDAITSLTQQSANFTAWLNGTDSNFTLVRDFVGFPNRPFFVLIWCLESQSVIQRSCR